MERILGALGDSRCGPFFRLFSGFWRELENRILGGNFWALERVFCIAGFLRAT